MSNPPTKPDDDTPFFGALLRLEKSLHAIVEVKRRQAALRFAGDRLRVLDEAFTNDHADALREWHKTTLDELSWPRRARTPNITTASATSITTMNDTRTPPPDLEALLIRQALVHVNGVLLRTCTAIGLSAAAYVGLWLLQPTAWAWLLGRVLLAAIFVVALATAAIAWWRQRRLEAVLRESRVRRK